MDARLAEGPGSKTSKLKSTPRGDSAPPPPTLPPAPRRGASEERAEMAWRSRAFSARRSSAVTRRTSICSSFRLLDAAAESRLRCLRSSDFERGLLLLWSAKRALLPGVCGRSSRGPSPSSSAHQLSSLSCARSVVFRSRVLFRRERASSVLILTLDPASLPEWLLRLIFA
eukprot:CAMPEP_0172599700 /NCGR_PEP_ID=MMETSP1068-20121228/19809_1 /TAXON_ID=35684 /ORGANISM="Pseudopedinella elastica, Strain CCMP716" /LENGTH=170 /DNA_ID=CAMNT_0013400035 /DNA_START=409 /DNA_END=917 /DNA_ORIENTATION=+